MSFNSYNPTAPCPTLDTVSNGDISYNSTTNMATYSCITGYTLTGSVSSLTCNEGTRLWSSTARPTCELGRPGHTYTAS